MPKRTDPSPRALALWRLDLCRTALEAEQWSILLHNAEELVKLAKVLSGGKGLRHSRRKRKQRAYLSNGSELGLVSQEWIEERTKGEHDE